MENRTVIITGGTSGLGRSLVKKYLAEGWNTATFGRREDRISSLISENNIGRLLAETCDIRFENHISRFISHVSSQFGKPDVVILNAGTLGPAPLPEVKDLSLIDLRMVMETNLFANFSFLRSVIPHMKYGGIIVHITSDAAENAYPGWSAYGASKKAMDHIIAVLDEECGGKGLHAFSMDPGDMDTEMHRLAIPEDKPEDLRKPDDSAGDIYKYITDKLEMSE